MNESFMTSDEVKGSFTSSRAEPDETVGAPR